MGPATESAIAAELKLNLNEYHRLLNDAQGAQLIYADELSDGSNNAMERLLAQVANEQTPLSQLEECDFLNALALAVGSLPERECKLMNLHYVEDCNFIQVAQVLGVTESRVSQLHSQAITRLRVALVAWIGNPTSSALVTTRH